MSSRDGDPMSSMMCRFGESLKSRGRVSQGEVHLYQKPVLRVIAAMAARVVCVCMGYRGIGYVCLYM
jgi:hypothetical protein